MGVLSCACTTALSRSAGAGAGVGSDMMGFLGLETKKPRRVSLAGLGSDVWTRRARMNYRQNYIMGG